MKCEWRTTDLEHYWESWHNTTGGGKARTQDLLNALGINLEQLDRLGAARGRARRRRGPRLRRQGLALVRRPVRQHRDRRTLPGRPGRTATRHERPSEGLGAASCQHRRRPVRRGAPGGARPRRRDLRRRRRPLLGHGRAGAMPELRPPGRGAPVLLRRRPGRVRALPLPRSAVDERGRATLSPAEAAAATQALAVTRGCTIAPGGRSSGRARCSPRPTGPAA